jgi:hypothetical protein
MNAANKSTSPLDQALTQQTQRRLARLRDILAQLKSGGHVQNRTLKVWLGDELYAQLEDSWQEQVELRNDLRNKPEAVLRYEHLLRKATFYDNRQLAAEARGQKSQGKLEDQATNWYERALDHLQEEFMRDQSLQNWFDRPLDFNEGSEVAAECGSMPQVVVSRSDKNGGGGLISRKRSKADVKIAVVERAIELATQGGNEQVDVGQLVRFLNAHSQDDI